MKQYRTIKGTKDLLPLETMQWREIEYVIHDFMELHGYGEIRTPAFEDTELFARSIGKDTDIVSKEMYTWQDQSGMSLSLKPELTAPVVRAYIQHQLASQSPVTKLYYIDSLFRHERPQKGRLRQFHQFGVEAFGAPHPEQDVEVIAIAYKIYELFGLEKLTLRLNTIGSSEIRPAYLKLLREKLIPHAEDLCQTCQLRLTKNALRVFDCKNENCQKILDLYAPLICDNVTNDDHKHYEQVQSLLTKMNIPFSPDGKLVRGLDYYTRTTFEITSSALGAQDALCGGGRYDGLVADFGGKPTPGIGFAAGMERLLLAIEGDNAEKISTADIYMVLLGADAIAKGFELADKLRKENDLRVICETLRRSMKAQMREANRSGALFAIILGDNELEKNVAVVKNMESGEQVDVPLTELCDRLMIEHNCECDCCAEQTN